MKAINLIEGREYRLDKKKPKWVLVKTTEHYARFSRSDKVVDIPLPQGIKRIQEIVYF